MSRGSTGTRTMLAVGGMQLETSTSSVEIDGVADPAREPARTSAYWYLGTTSLVAVGFLLVALVRGQVLDLGLRDPRGQMFSHRIVSALEVFAVLSVIDVAWRTWRQRGSWASKASRGGFRALLSTLGAVARDRWSWRRLLLAGLGVLAYHVIYLSYRNLKSWDALNTPQDSHLLALDHWLFFGHDPATLLQHLFGTGAAATVLMVVYRAFTYLSTTSLEAALAFVTRIRDAYVFVAAAMWAWVLAIASYYAIPTLGPFASEPQAFASLPQNEIARTQAKYLVERAAFLADPHDPTTFVSISAFASLHVGFTFMVVLMARYYRQRAISIVLTVYLVAVVLSTIYFGWHFFVDDVAGAVLALLAVGLGHVTVYGLRRRPTLE